MMSNEKTANINVKIKNFFFRFIQFTAPFHNLSNQYQKVLSLLLYHHYMLNKEITNNKILWKMVFDYDTKLKICEELNIQSSALENIFSQLRKKNVIVNNEISPVYIPELTNDSKNFTIKFNFNISYE